MDKITVDDIIALAKTQIGYHEKESNKDLDDFTANSGDKNYTKYARDCYVYGLFNGNKQGYEWCTTFYNWLWVILTKTRSATMERLCQSGDLGAGCVFAQRYYADAGRLYERPQIGDQAFMGQSVEDPDHTGLVISVDGNYFTTIEGNWNHQVSKVVHKLNGDSTWKTFRFGRPKYDASVVVPSVMLRIYDHGDAVQILQAILCNHGYDVGSAGVDGDFGAATKLAVVQFQRDKGLEVDGVVGPDTWRALLS